MSKSVAQNTAGKSGVARSTQGRVSTASALLASQTSQGSAAVCHMCRERGHKIAKCPKFKWSSIEEQWQVVREHHLCFNCFKPANSFRFASVCRHPRCSAEGSTRFPPQMKYNHHLSYTYKWSIILQCKWPCCPGHGPAFVRCSNSVLIDRFDFFLVPLLLVQRLTVVIMASNSQEGKNWFLHVYMNLFKALYNRFWIFITSTTTFGYCKEL